MTQFLRVEFLRVEILVPPVRKKVQKCYYEPMVQQHNLNPFMLWSFKQFLSALSFMWELKQCGSHITVDFTAVSLTGYYQSSASTLAKVWPVCENMAELYLLYF